MIGIGILTSRHANTGDKKTLKGMHIADIAWRGLVTESYETRLDAEAEMNILEVEYPIDLILLSQSGQSGNRHRLTKLAMEIKI